MRTRSSPPRKALTRVAATVCLLAWLALSPPHAQGAQDPSPAPETLWKAYPLSPTAAPSTQPSATSSPAVERRPLGSAEPRGDAGAPVAVLVLLGLLTTGAVTLVAMRRRREHEPLAQDVPHSPASNGTPRAMPIPERDAAGRFVRSRSPAMVVSTHVWSQGGSPQGDGPPEPDATAARPRRVRPPVTAPAGSPPDRRLAWTAEIEWRLTDGASRFCVVARGAGTVTVAQSRPLEWPPAGEAAVQAMTDAADELAATLTAAGWKALPPGQGWYAKRFAWEPTSAPDEAETSPSARRSGGPVAAEASSDQGAPHALRRGRTRLALLCVLLVLGPLAVLQFGSSDDGAEPAKPGSAQATATPAAKPSSPGGTDLSVPLIVLLGILSLGIVIHAARRSG